MKKWRILTKIKEKDTDKRQEEIIKALLKNRGLNTKRKINEFLSPPYPSSFDAQDFNIDRKELEKAVKRIKKGLEKSEKIVVYGDYDADGVCGTAILWETLYKLRAESFPYIPDRVSEGYGISKKGIDKIKEKFNPSLIITVDNGIVQRKAVEYARQNGIKVIITDHHLPPKKIPQAEAVIHTTSLSGSGVAWVLARGLLKKCNKIGTIVPKTLHFNNHLGLVAIGTIADLIPLLGVNRSLVKYGLEELNKTKRVGLKALIKEAGLNLGRIGTYEIGFIIAPRLNAAGRLTHALDSLRLLCTNDIKGAEYLAQKLGRVNRERQKLMEEAIVHARNIWTSFSTPGVEKLIFISHQSYHEGVIGLVAGKLVEQFYRPAIVVSKGEEISRASARSINGFNIIEAIRSFSELLIDCGGHPMAAGFTIETTHLQSLKEKLEKLAQKELDEEKLKKVLKIDCEIDLADIGWGLYKKIQKFQPFGLGNPEPVFAAKGVNVLDARVVGREGKHLKLKFGQKDTASKPINTAFNQYTSEPVLFWATLRGGFEGIAFGMGELYPQLSPDVPIDIAFSLILDEWNGEKRLQLKIKDIRFKSASEV